MMVADCGKSLNQILQEFSEEGAGVQKRSSRKRFSLPVSLKLPLKKHIFPCFTNESAVIIEIGKIVLCCAFCNDGKI